VTSGVRLRRIPLQEASHQQDGSADQHGHEQTVVFVSVRLAPVIITLVENARL